MTPCLTVVGLGPGDPGLVTLAAREALVAADVIFVPRQRDAARSLALELCAPWLDPARQTIQTLPLVMRRDDPDTPAAWDAAAAAIAAQLAPERRVVYALLGDPLLYGSFAPLAERLRARCPEVVIRYLPGVSAFSAGAAALGLPLVNGAEHLMVLSGLGLDAAMLEQALGRAAAIAIFKAGAALELIRQRLARAPEWQGWLIERLGHAQQRIVALHDAAPDEVDYFALALLRRRERPARHAAGRVVFVGAGPGAPDLVTLRGREVIAAADAVLYADSLVPEALLAWARPDARCVPTAGLDLERIMAIMREVVAAGGLVARVHSGDPSLYGAIHEQMHALEQAGIPYEIVPGVTAAMAAAARLKTELTVPGVTQTLILSRVSGRASPVPEREALQRLATHGASLAIYLAATKAHQVQAELLAGGYAPDTPVAIAYRVEWPDEQIVRCRLDELAATMRACGFSRQTVILVGPALAPAPAARSRLYAADYVHRFRGASRDAAPRPPGLRSIPPSAGPAVAPAIVAVSRAGSLLAQRLAEQLGAVAYVPQRFAGDASALRGYGGGVVEQIRRLWSEHAALVLIMASGIAVRAIAPLLEHKQRDAAVVVCDDAGRYAISLLGGHHGADRLAQRVAAALGAQAILTGAAEGQGLPALDQLAAERGWRLAPGSALTRVMAALVNGEPLALWDPLGLLNDVAWPAGVHRLSQPPTDQVLEERWLLAVTDAAPQAAWLERGAVFHPPTIIAGVGCRRGASATGIETALRAACRQAGVAWEALAALATVTLKADEPGLLALAERYRLPLQVFSAEELRARAADLPLSPSAATARLDLPGVAEPCALLAAGSRALLLPKQALADVTVALARREVPLHG
ncbi:precorrin-4 C(11)-methyltransferase [Kallotenue papyrolyticum]|uniref:precorrin-4 C(11)-methyltransferase n=1 Tax=Kallotenue papyrolyticum TaxID=1325125 RepID=UPI0004785BB3|nr:precorrin-4 C(11)-methyltransferase [Kallotenue papyrolyticum]